jgi:WD40 repeat protein
MLFPDNKQIAVGDRNHSIKIWNANTGKLMHTLLGHTDHIRSLSYSSDSKQIVSASFDSIIKIWNSLTGKLIQTLTDDAQKKFSLPSVCYSPNNKKIISAFNNIKVWDVSTGQLTNTIGEPTSTIYTVCCSSYQDHELLERLTKN